jgi:hypothetical protein
MLRKLAFQPGINREGTDYSAEGGWYDCNNIRFRKGRPEKIGGWEQIGATFLGICRAMHNWSTFAGYNYLAMGTSSKAYIEYREDFYDITPSYDHGYTKLGTTTGGLLGSGTTGVTAKITEDGISDAGIRDNDVIRITSPYVSVGVGSVVDEGGPDEYCLVTATDDTTTGYDELTITRAYFESAIQKHSVIVKSIDGVSIFVDGPIVQRIPYATVTGSPTTSSLGGPIGVVNGSATVLMGQDDHGCIAGDYVTFLKLGSALSSASGMDTADFTVSSGFRVVRNLTDDYYEIEIGTTDASTTNGLINESGGFLAAATGTDTVTVTGSWGSYSADFYVRCEEEYMKVTGISSQDLTVTRAQFGTTGARHDNGVQIAKVEFLCAEGSGLTYVLHDINSGPTNQVPSDGWGRSSWGSGKWDIGSGTGTDVRIWSIDNYGQDLILCPRDEAPYYWIPLQNTTDGVPNTSPASVSDATITLNVPMAQAVPLSSIGNSDDRGYSDSISNTSKVPAAIRELMVFPAVRIVIAFGASDRNGDFDPMGVRWSSMEAPGAWDPLDLDNPGEADYIRMGDGSEIIAAARAKQEILFWTDTAVYRMTYIDSTTVFGFEEIGSSISCVGPKAVVTAGDSIYWMGDRNFYVYSGSMSVIPCSVLNYVYSDMNYSQRSLFFASSNSEFNEVSFFYISAGSDLLEVDRHATFNYAENVWTIGSLDRTAWNDSGLRSKPYATASYDPDANTSVLYKQESGNDNGSSALTAFIESAYFDIDEGDHFSFIHRIIPDVKFISGGDTGMDIKIKKKDFPNDLEESSPSSSAVTSSTTQSYIRVRGRQALVRFESTGLDVKWRLGDTRMDVRPDGRR